LANDNKVLELIDKVDANYSLRNWGPMAYLWLGLIVVLGILIYLTELTYQDLGGRFAIAAAGIAVVLSIGQFMLDDIRSGIAGSNYRKLLAGEEDPVLYALVLMKTDHPKIKLREIYRVNHTLFQPEKLVESLYN